MAIGDKRYYRLRRIAPRHFYQTGRSAGFHKQDIDELFVAIAGKREQGVANTRNAAEGAGMPEKAAEAILRAVRERARMIQEG